MCMDWIVGHPPILPEAPKLLLLGSMPSAASLEKAQYYGHARNHFWPLMAAVLGACDPVEYEARKRILIDNGVALWDSIHACRRSGSLDQNIRDAEPNDIAGLLEVHPSIAAIAFNGAMAQRVYDRHFPRKRGLVYLQLPSSSPVPTSACRRMEDKLPAWVRLREYLLFIK